MPVPHVRTHIPPCPHALWHPPHALPSPPIPGLQRANAGDRVGVCVTQLDAGLIERGLACSPGTVPTFRGAVAAVEKIRFYAGGSAGWRGAGWRGQRMCGKEMCRGGGVQGRRGGIEEGGARSCIAP